MVKYWKRLGIEELHYERLGTHGVLIEDNIIVEDKLWIGGMVNNTAMEDRLFLGLNLAYDINIYRLISKSD